MRNRGLTGARTHGAGSLLRVGLGVWVTVAAAVSSRADRVPAELQAVRGWTNRVGHVLQASLVDYGNGGATFRSPSRSDLRLPLSALCDSDQRLIRSACGESSAPDYAVAALRDARAVVTRYDRLPAASKPEGGRDGVVASAHALFDARVAACASTNLPATVIDDIARLRHSLR